MRADALERDHGRPHGLLVDAPAVAGLGNVASARPSASRNGASRSDAGKSSCASCSARPAYWRIWRASIPETSSKNQPQLVYMSMRVPLHLEELQGARSALPRRSVPARVPREESVDALGRAVEDHVDVVVARLPGVGEQAPPRRSSKSGASASRSQSSASRSGARQAWFQPGCAPVWQPQSLRQRSTPCAQLQEVLSRDLDLVRRADASRGTRRSWSGARARARLDRVERVGERHVAVAVVVAVGLAVGGDVDELRPAPRRRRRRPARRPAKLARRERAAARRRPPREIGPS